MKTFLKLAGILLVVFNLFIFLSAYMDHTIADVNQSFVWMSGIFYPLLLASIATTGFRTGTIYINDYQGIPDFKEKLKSKIKSENMSVQSEIESQTIYKPSGGYFSLFKAWGGAETLTATWNEEIVLSGSLRKITVLEDILTWNKDFNPLRPADTSPKLGEE